jgi:hypothetical protein
MQFSPFPCSLVALRAKYLPQHPIIEHPLPYVLSLIVRRSFILTQKQTQNNNSLEFELQVFKNKKSSRMILFHKAAELSCSTKQQNDPVPQGDRMILFHKAAE